MFILNVCVIGSDFSFDCIHQWCDQLLTQESGVSIHLDRDQRSTWWIVDSFWIGSNSNDFRAHRVFHSSSWHVIINSMCPKCTVNLGWCNITPWYRVTHRQATSCCPASLSIIVSLYDLGSLVSSETSMLWRLGLAVTMVPALLNAREQANHRSWALLVCPFRKLAVREFSKIFSASFRWDSSKDSQ